MSDLIDLPELRSIFREHMKRGELSAAKAVVSTHDSQFTPHERAVLLASVADRSNNPASVLEALKGITPPPKLRPRWFDLQVRALTALGRHADILSLYTTQPDPSDVPDQLLAAALNAALYGGRKMVAGGLLDEALARQDQSLAGLAIEAQTLLGRTKAALARLEAESDPETRNLLLRHHLRGALRAGRADLIEAHHDRLDDPQIGYKTLRNALLREAAAGTLTGPAQQGDLEERIRETDREVSARIKSLMAGTKFEDAQAAKKLRADIQTLVRAGDPQSALERLNSAEGIIPELERQFLRAGALLRDHQFDEVMELVSLAESAGVDDPRLLATKLRAMSGLKKDAEVLDIVAELDSDTADRADIMAITLHSNLFLERWDIAADLADRARSLHPEDKTVRDLALNAFVLGGQDAAALDLLDTAPDSSTEEDLLGKFIDASLVAKRADLIAAQAERRARYDVVLSRHAGRTLRALYRGRVVQAPSVKATASGIGETVKSLAEENIGLEANYDMTRVMYLYEQNEAAEIFKERYLSEGAKRSHWVLPNPNQQPALAKAVHIPNESALEGLANWLEIDEFRDAWKAEVRENANMESEMNMAFQNDQSTLHKFGEMVPTCDTRYVRPIYDAKGSAILCGTHLGYLMASFTQMHNTQIMARAIGGTQLEHDTIDGGHVLIPAPESGSDTALVRTVIRLLREGTFVCLAGDIPRGRGNVEIRGRGYKFSLPTSVPFIAYREKVPVFFMSIYWKNRKLFCECDPAPLPGESESYESYLDRWIAYMTAKLREVALYDVRNVAPFGNIRAVPIIED